MSFLSGFAPKISVAKADANVIARRMKDASTLIKTAYFAPLLVALVVDALIPLPNLDFC